MFETLEDEYQDPGAVGSLSGALRIWQTLEPVVGQPRPHYCLFAFSCASELRAERLARTLRRRIAGMAARVSRVSGGDTWDVRGRTHPETPSLTSLERLSTWLRRSGATFQADLVHLSLVETAP